MLSLQSRGKPLLRNKSFRSGTIWKRQKHIRARAVRNVCDKLEAAYGKPRLGNPRDPLDDLVYIVLSNKTGPRISRKTYNNLRDRFTDWDRLLAAPASAVRSLLKPAGLSSVKSRHLRAALRAIQHRFGSCDLGPLKRMPTEEVERFLLGLPGVSEKVAKCVMMYTLNAKVLPIDVHVHRIARRLGWTARKRADQCHQELESLVPPDRRFAFHVDCVLHGRQICRPNEPLCSNCCVRTSCDYFRKNRSHV